MTSEKQVTAWCFTSYDAFDFRNGSDKIKYLVGQWEQCPNSGKPHFQGYVIFHRSQRMSSVKRFLGSEKIHLEIARGSVEDNYKYCTKTGEEAKKDGKGGRIPGTEVIEFGTKPETKQGKRSDFDTFLEFLDDQKESLVWLDVCMQFPALTARYEKWARNMISMKKLNLIEEQYIRTKPGIIHWICGETGTGKTTYCINHLKDAYWKSSEHGWWDKYGGQDDIIINEWINDKEVDIMKIFKWCDIGNVSVNIKGLTPIDLKSTNIWVTTNWKPNEILNKVPDANRDAFLRRSKFYNVKDGTLIELEKVDNKAPVDILLDKLMKS